MGTNVKTRWYVLTSGCDGHSGCIAKVELDECRAIEQQDHGKGRIQGAALGHDVGRGEQLHGVNGGDGDHKIDDRTQAGEGHMPQRPPFARTINRSRLDEVAWDTLEGSKIDDHVIAHVFPDTGSDDDPLRLRAVSQERLRGDTDGLQQTVEDALLLEEDQPDE